MHKIVYMEWVKTRPRARYEVGGSGIIPVHIDELPEARDTLDLNDFNLYGYPPLVKAIADRYETAADQVVTTQGTSMANYLAVASIVSSGDEVLVESPAYEPLLSVPLLLGCKIVRFERRFRDGFRLNVDELASRLTSQTKLVILSNMHNPSGVLASEDVLRETGRVAQKVGAHVLVDEVYMDFLFEARPRSAVHFGPNFLVTSSLTKCYGLDGLRCGWILAPPALATAIWRLQDFFGVNGAIPAEKCSVAAFQNLGRFIERTRGIIGANRPLVDEFMAAHRDHLEYVPPDAGPVCFPRLRQGDAGDFCNRLRSEYDVGVIPGHFFEMPRHFRIGFGGPTDHLKAGLERLGSALSEPR